MCALCNTVKSDLPQVVTSFVSHFINRSVLCVGQRFLPLGAQN